MYTTVETTSRIGTNAVQQLREKKLSSGLPFMINATELDSNQCYLEYPDGTIQLVSIVSATQDISVIRDLSQNEANLLRQRFHFTQIS